MKVVLKIIIPEIILGLLCTFLLSLVVNADTITASGNIVDSAGNNNGTFGGASAGFNLPLYNWPNPTSYQFSVVNEIPGTREPFCYRISWYSQYTSFNVNASVSSYASNFSYNNTSTRNFLGMVTKKDGMRLYHDAYFSLSLPNCTPGVNCVFGAPVNFNISVSPPDYKSNPFFAYSYNPNLLYWFIVGGANSSNVPCTHVQTQLNQAKLDSQTEEIKKGNDLQKEQNDYLMDDTAPNSDISGLGTVQGLLPPGPLDSLLNLPATALSVTLSSLSGTCLPIDAPLPYVNKNIQIPCFDQIIYNESGFSNLMTWVGIVPAAFILLSYFKRLYKKIDRATSLQTTDEDEWGAV